MSAEKDILLKKWIEGSITAREERRLFALAEADPLLSEALQGYSSLADAAPAASLDRIRKKLNPPTPGRSARLLLYVRAAAAILLIGISIAGIGYFLRQPKEARLAQAPLPEKELTEPGAISAPESDEEAAQESVPQALQLPPPPPAESTEQILASRPETAGTTTLGSTDEHLTPEAITADRLPDTYGEEDPERGRAAPTTALPPEERITDEALPARIAAESMGVLPQPAKARLQAPDGRILSGQVVDEAGDPLVGANIVNPATSLGTVTDLQGRFRLLVPDSLSESEWLVSYTGYESASIRPTSVDSPLIRLEPKLDALSEVVASQNGKRKARPAAGASPGPEPRRGFDRLERYIQNNLKYPPSARQQEIEGEVILEFSIDEQGRPDQVTIEKGLGHGCDQEAIRLLKEGPRWTSPPSDSTRVRYRVPFRLRR